MDLLSSNNSNLYVVFVITALGGITARQKTKKDLKKEKNNPMRYFIDNIYGVWNICMNYKNWSPIRLEFKDLENINFVKKLRKILNILNVIFHYKYKKNISVKVFLFYHDTP